MMCTGPGEGQNNADLTQLQHDLVERPSIEARPEARDGATSDFAESCEAGLGGLGVASASQMNGAAANHSELLQAGQPQINLDLLSRALPFVVMPVQRPDGCRSHRLRVTVGL